MSVTALIVGDGWKVISLPVLTISFRTLKLFCSQHYPYYINKYENTIVYAFQERLMYRLNKFLFSISFTSFTAIPPEAMISLQANQGWAWLVFRQDFQVKPGLLQEVLLLI